MGKTIICILFFQAVLSIQIVCAKKDTTFNSTNCKVIKTIDGSSILSTDFREFLLKGLYIHNIPGLSIAVINNKEIVFSENLGVKNFLKKDSVDSRSLFEACSLSKPIFAYFLLDIFNKCGLPLDQPIYLYYMDNEIDYSFDYYKYLTVSNVLNHSSGWVNWRKSVNERLTFNFKPGTKSTYSGEGYQFLKRYLLYRLDISDFKLNSYFQELLVDKLNCSPMSFLINENNLRSLVSSHKVGEKIEVLPNNNNFYFDAAGGLITNAEAYANFIISLLNKNNKIADELLNLRKNLPQESDGLFRSFGFPYKLINNKIRYFHSGINSGARAYCHFYKTEGFGIVIFANSDNLFSSGFAKEILEFLKEPYPY